MRNDPRPRQADEELINGGAGDDDVLDLDALATPDENFGAAAEEDEEEEVGGGADLLKRDTDAEPDENFGAAAEEEDDEDEEKVAGGDGLLDLDALFLANAEEEEEEERGDNVEETVGGFARPPSPTAAPPPPPPSSLRVVENDADQGDVVYSDVTVDGAGKEGAEPLAAPLSVGAEQPTSAADESVYGELDFSKANANGDGGAGADDAAVVYGELTFDGGEPASPSAAGEVVYGKIPAESNLQDQQETPAALAELNPTTPTTKGSIFTERAPRGAADLVPAATHAVVPPITMISGSGLPPRDWPDMNIGSEMSASSSGWPEPSRISSSLADGTICTGDVLLPSSSNIPSAHCPLPRAVPATTAPPTVAGTAWSKSDESPSDDRRRWSMSHGGAAPASSSSSSSAAAEPSDLRRRSSPSSGPGDASGATGIIWCGSVQATCCSGSRRKHLQSQVAK
jgi:hypothetical protein